MAPLDPILASALASHGSQLGRRARTEQLMQRYLDGNPLPQAIVSAKLTKAYALLMGVSAAPWASLVVSSVMDRLEVSGLESDDSNIDDELRGVWQDQALDAESPLAHHAALVSGRSFALVWPGDDGQPEVCLDDSSQMIVKYVEGSRRKRVSAMRYWFDEDERKPYCTLYTPKNLYKFVGGKDENGPDGVTWQERQVPDEPWPLPNPFGCVPVVELPVNRRLKSGPWGYARGEFAHCLPILDRVALLTFIGLVVALNQGFPLRGVVGERILRDDDNQPLPPFEVAADQVVQFENPDAKLVSFPAADRANLSIYAELSHLAALTSTPQTYFPTGGPIANVSADAIRSLESPLVAKMPTHQASLGGGWQEVLRLAGLMLPEPVILNPRAAIQWHSATNRSLAEQSDAAVKLFSLGLPMTAVAELALNVTQEQLARWKADATDSALGQLLTAATAPTVAPVMLHPNMITATPPSNGAS